MMRVVPSAHSDDERFIAHTVLTRTIRADNPGPMTLEGTNSYLISRDWSSTIVVDPGPADERHLHALNSVAPVVLILITHRHPDHTDGAARLGVLTGAPVRAMDPGHCHGGGAVLLPGSIESAGVVIDVVPTPGHTDDSVSFHLAEDGPTGSMLTGDTILGRGTTVIAHPDGDLGDYLESLDRLESYGAATVLPAHGPQLPALDTVVRSYREHRLQRLEQIRTARRALGTSATTAAVVDLVYTDISDDVRTAALKSVAAQLEYLDRNDASDVRG